MSVHVNGYGTTPEAADVQLHHLLDGHDWLDWITASEPRHTVCPDGYCAVTVDVVHRNHHPFTLTGLPAPTIGD